MEKNKRRIQDNILFLGNRDDVYRLYQAMDVFVLPSRYEGLPVAGVEAQAAGLPCLFSDQITREAKISETAGFLGIGEKNDWVRAILQYHAQERTLCMADLAEWDINLQAETLARYYKNLSV